MVAVVEVFEQLLRNDARLIWILRLKEPIPKISRTIESHDVALVVLSHVIEVLEPRQQFLPDVGVLDHDSNPILDRLRLTFRK